MIYHGSFMQNMKVLNPVTNINSDRTIRGATKKEFCLGFIFSWNHKLANMTKRKTLPGHYRLTLDNSLKPLLNKPCSIYTVEDALFKDGKNEYEKLTTGSARVIMEEKYESVIECLRDIGTVEIQFEEMKTIGKFMGCCG